MLKFRLTAGLLILLLAACSHPQPRPHSEEFIRVSGTRFIRSGKPYFFLGANFWYGMNLASNGPGGDRARLLRELDQFKELGLNNLRIMASSEGPDLEPWRVIPSLQPSKGVYDRRLLEGLDFLLAEMHKRGLVAVLTLGNFWNWSGGFAQYRRWEGAEPIPYPPPEPGGSWPKFMEYAARFYSEPKATGHFRDFVRLIVTRKNTITGLSYAEDPTIMAWDLANEPRAMNNLTDYLHWLDETSKYIKTLDPNHLVTTGSEGELGEASNEVIRDHRFAAIDYATAHIWPQNRGWYDPLRAGKTFKPALETTRLDLKKHVNLAKKLGKPLVLEEFGFARDQSAYSPKSKVTYRDRFYRFVFEQAEKYMKAGELSGANFWAWGGEGIPRKPAGSWWKPGDPFIGDPPHEHQGWYSIFSTDRSTLTLFSKYAKRFSALAQ